MNLAYIILAHKNPQQLRRLMTRLGDADCTFYVHIDKRSKIEPFRSELTTLPNHQKRIVWVKREECRWGDVGMVKGTLHALSCALRDNRDVDYLVLLSGQDYPIKPVRSIIEFFEEHRRLNFVAYSPMPINRWRSGGMDRIQRYHFFFKGKRRVYPPGYRARTWRGKLLRALLRLVFPLPRKFPTGLQPYGGSSWWCITAETARYVLDFVRKRPDYLRFHAYSMAPDEIFFQTILLNSSSMAETIVNDNLRYIDWTRGGGQPAILTADCFDRLAESPKLFARKFDMSVDQVVLDMIDERILHPNSGCRRDEAQYNPGDAAHQVQA
jgi:hypothetical protein